jgi:methyltransferase-like protein/2-polyprenyl-3-methyl-5-hydroxy-6-metoxy-1,4-benzoquinol methylase
MPDRPDSPYDLVPYPSCPFVQTHPDRLATLATLFGMHPAPIDRCRVLELGCGDGSNLIPMALGLPQSEFVGIDAASVPQAKGRSVAEQLSLKNIVLKTVDILELSPDFGQFDYIIAHGVFSWVPAEIQQKILAICRANLAPQGVAYVSYNTYPGWHLRQMVREMMLFHVQQVEDPSQKVSQGRALVKFLAQARADADPFGAFLAAELEHQSERRIENVFHDDLADINTPLYFCQFMEQANNQGLRYLAEADFFEMQAHCFSPQVRETLQSISPDLHSREQYLDFLKCRRFRQTLLCHQETQLQRALSSEQVKKFYASADVVGNHPLEEVRSTAEIELVNPRRAALKTNSPLAKAALFCLNQVWPQALFFEDLLSRVDSLLRPDSDLSGCPGSDESSELAEMILACFGTGLVELCTRKPPLDWQVSDRPVASPLARLQARNSSLLTTLRHTTVKFDDLLRQLVQLLDGTRDHETLLAELTSYATSRAPTVSADGQSRPLPLPSREDLEGALSLLARSALLAA